MYNVGLWLKQELELASLISPERRIFKRAWAWKGTEGIMALNVFYLEDYVYRVPNIATQSMNQQYLVIVLVPSDRALNEDNHQEEILEFQHMHILEGA